MGSFAMRSERIPRQSIGHKNARVNKTRALCVPLLRGVNSRSTLTSANARAENWPKIEFLSLLSFRYTASSKSYTYRLGDCDEPTSMGSCGPGVSVNSITTL